MYFQSRILKRWRALEPNLPAAALFWTLPTPTSRTTPQTNRMYPVTINKNLKLTHTWAPMWWITRRSIYSIFFLWWPKLPIFTLPIVIFNSRLGSLGVIFARRIPRKYFRGTIDSRRLFLKRAWVVVIKFGIAKIMRQLRVPLRKMCRLCKYAGLKYTGNDIGPNAEPLRIPDRD